jgi:hypothetical protein
MCPSKMSQLGPEVTVQEVDEWIAKLDKKQGYLKNVIAFLMTVIGRPIKSPLLIRIPGRGDNMVHKSRRWYEIRDSEGYKGLVNYEDELGKAIGLTHEQWCLTTADKVENADRGVNKKIADRVFRRDNSTCRRCGAVAGQPHHQFPDKIVKLHVGHLVPFTLERKAKYTEDDFETLCSQCNEGEKAHVMTTEMKIEMLTRQLEQLRASLLNEQKTDTAQHCQSADTSTTRTP